MTHRFRILRGVHAMAFGFALAGTALADPSPTPTATPTPSPTPTPTPTPVVECSGEVVRYDLDECSPPQTTDEGSEPPEVEYGTTNAEHLSVATEALWARFIESEYASFGSRWPLNPLPDRDQQGLWRQLGMLASR